MMRHLSQRSQIADSILFADYARAISLRFNDVVPRVFREVRVKSRGGYWGVIDYVFTLSNSIDNEKYFPCYSAGIELKTSYNDLRCGNGKNFFSYPFNYLAVTENIKSNAISTLRKDEKLRHVGLIVVYDNFVSRVESFASKPQDTSLLSNPDYVGDLSKCVDPIKLSFEPFENVADNYISRSLFARKDTA